MSSERPISRKQHDFYLSDKSVIYPIFSKICQLAERASLLAPARRRFGRYLAVELLLLTFLAFEIASVAAWSVIPFVLQIAIVAVAVYRLTTMTLAHISILLLGAGKSSPGRLIHSRLRYLGLTFLNFWEIVLIGSIIQLLILSGMPQTHFILPVVADKAGIIYYNFQLASLISLTASHPASPIAYSHAILISGTGFVIVAVVLTILLSISPADELVNARWTLEDEAYWTWRSQRYDDNQLTNSSLTGAIVANVLAQRARSCADIGCGTGRTSVALALSGVFTTGIDYSDGMLAIARETHMPNLIFQQGDARSLPVATASHDAVVLRMVLHNVLPDWRPVLSEAYRVLKPGGLMVIVEGSPPTDESSDFFRRVLMRVHPRHFFTLQELMDEVEQHGFDYDRSELFHFQLRVKPWLVEAVPDRIIREQLLVMHASMPEECRIAYSAVVEDDDIEIDVPLTMLTAIRPRRSRRPSSGTRNYRN